MKALEQRLMASRKKIAAQVEALREEALSSIAAQKHEQAIQALETLISIDPKNPEWPRRAADSHWYLKNAEKRLEYSALAAKLYADRGLLLKAIAMCKVVLSIDPAHRETQDQLARLKTEGPKKKRAPPAGPKASANPLAKIRLKTQAILQKKREQQAESARDTDQAHDNTQERRVMAMQALQGAKARQRARRAQARMEAAAKVRAARVRLAKTQGIGLPLVSLPPAAPSERPSSTLRSSSPPERSADPSPRFHNSTEAFPSIPAPPAIRPTGRPLQGISLNKRVTAAPKKSKPPLRGGIYSLRLEDVPASELRAERIPHLAPRDAPSLRVSSPLVIEPQVGINELVLPASSTEPDFDFGGRGAFAIEPSLRDQTPSFSDTLSAFSVPSVESKDEVVLEFVDNEPGTGGFALENTPLLSALDPIVLRDLISDLALVEVEAGSFLFKEGDTADAMYVVVEGELVATTSPEGSRPIELAHLEEGEFFGEIGLLSDQPRQASVVAKVNSRLLRFDRESISQLMEKDPDFLAVLLSFLRERLVEGLMNTSPLFAPFNEQERLALAEQFEFLEIEPDAVLLDPGQRPVGMYVLLTGEALCTGGAGPAGLQTLGPGDIFGERALLNNAASELEVVTLTKSFALCLPSDSFFEVIMTHPTVLEYVSSLGDHTRHGEDAPLDHVAFY